MSLNKDGVIVILSSPSGAGKTTLVKKISSLIDFTISISYTTRIPRINEVNGKDYYFINRDQFNDLVTKDEFLEYAKVFENYSLRNSIYFSKATSLLFAYQSRLTANIFEKFFG